MEIKIFTTGGTIDKIYFDQKSAYQVGEPAVDEVLKESNVTVSYQCETLLHKDSLDLTDDDRQTIYNAVAADRHRQVIITHGTDTMIQTAQKLQRLTSDRVIVLTGSMMPAKFRASDAEFNIGCAIIAVQTLPPGVYIAMNGQIFDPAKVRKNVELNRFERID